MDPGSAMLECRGGCEADVSADVQCEASAELVCSFRGPAVACSGECTARGPDLDCSGAAEARCEAMGEASVSCQGQCQGELEPPTAMAQCEAAASCDAQARADASVEVECSEPALDVEYALRADLDAEVAAQMELGMRQLELRLPRILARLEQATLLVDASAELGAAATGAAEATVDAFSGGDLGFVAALRVVECAPAQLEAVPGLIAGSTAALQASLSAAVDVRGAVGL